MKSEIIQEFIMKIDDAQLVKGDILYDSKLALIRMAAVSVRIYPIFLLRVSKRVECLDLNSSLRSVMSFIPKMCLTHS